MRILLLLALFVGFNFTQAFAQDSVEVKNIAGIPFHEAIPNAGTKKAERFANVLKSYINSIENDDYEAWYGLLSDSTKTRVAPHKFKNKFRRLKEYKLSAEGMEVVSIETLKESFENERGTEYVVTLKFVEPLDVSNRVSFDHQKVTKESDDASLFSVNMITTDKSYKICVHKYVKKGNGAGSNEEE